MSDEPVKQNEPVRLTSDDEQMKWLMCLQAASTLVMSARAAMLPGEAQWHEPSYQADKLYRELRERCVK